MIRLLIPGLVIAMALPGSVVLDRIAVIVGKRAIKTSDIDRDLRLTQFLNREPLNVAPDIRRKSAERLIDQEIIREEIATGGYRRPAESDAAALEKQVTQERFGGSDARLREALTKYGLTEPQFREQLLWQLTVLRFIDQRFRAGVLVTDDDVKTYFEQHRSSYPGNTLEMAQPKIRESIEGERINQAFNDWLEQARKRYRIEYRQDAFE